MPFTGLQRETDASLFNPREGGLYGADARFPVLITIHDTEYQYGKSPEPQKDKSSSRAKKTTKVILSRTKQNRTDHAAQHRFFYETPSRDEQDAQVADLAERAWQSH